ncbi:MAG: tetratricopeptide repeat protein [Deinococcales bacterium]
MELKLLAACSVHVGARQYAIPSDKRGALLVYLALQPRAVSRQQLCDLLWRESSEFEARRNLRQLLHRSAQLPYAQAIVRSSSNGNEQLSFSGTSDVHEFWRLLETRNHAALHCTPQLLPTFVLRDCPPFMEWLELEQQKILQAWRTLALEVADTHLMRGQADEAIALLERVLEFEPLAEDALQLLLEISRQNALFGRGIAAFHNFESVLQREVGLLPAQRTLELLAALQPEREVRMLEPPRLPAPKARFFGRAQELELLRAWLVQPETRLLSIVGAGGVGKTRFAQELCPDAVMVRLEHAQDEAALLGCVADALGILFAAHQDTRQQLLARLAAKPQILLLDNYEQLLPHTDLVCQLLEVGVRLLVTSREALNLPLERVYRLAGLDQKSATALFLERAMRHNARLLPQQRTIEKITSLLEGIPLALALAAAWVSTLDLQELAQELQNNLGLLEWKTVLHTSVKRLNPNLKAKFLALAVCAGGFEREAALALAGANLGDQAGEALCLYQLGNVDEGVGDFVGAEKNFTLALQMMRQQDDAAATARTLNSLGLLSLNSGNAQAAVHYHLESLELRRRKNAPRAMFTALLNLGDARKHLGQLEAARELLEASYKIAADIGDHFGETLALSHLADIARRENDLEWAHGSQSLAYGLATLGLQHQANPLQRSELEQVRQALEPKLDQKQIAHANTLSFEELLLPYVEPQAIGVTPQ